MTIAGRLPVLFGRLELVEMLPIGLEVARMGGAVTTGGSHTVVVLVHVGIVEGFCSWASETAPRTDETADMVERL